MATSFDTTWDDDVPIRDVAEEPLQREPEEDWDENLYPILHDVYGQSRPSVEAYRELREMYRRQDTDAKRLGPRVYGRRCE